MDPQLAELTIATLITVGSAYTTRNLYMGKTTVSVYMARMGRDCPAVIALWGAGWAVVLPGLSSWTWAACGALTAHWWLPILTPKEAPFTTAVGAAICIAWAFASRWVSPAVALGFGAVLAAIVFPPPVVQSARSSKR